MAEVANKDQAEFWSGASGEVWSTQQPFLDALLAPALDALFQRLHLAPGETVLDIGCGTGASLLRAAHDVGSQGKITGADVSVPMLSKARERAAGSGLANVECVDADAQVYDFSNMNADWVISRFGVMFFEDPYAAFENISKALKSGGRICFVTWAGPHENPWFRTPAECATAVVGAPPAGDPRDPGPMAFAEQDYVEDILTQAGFSNIASDVVPVMLTPPGSVEQVAAFAGSEGPAGRILRTMEATETDKRAVIDQLIKVFAEFDTSDGVKVPGLLNVFSAVKPENTSKQT